MFKQQFCFGFFCHWLLTDSNVELLSDFDVKVKNNLFYFYLKHFLSVMVLPDDSSFTSLTTRLMELLLVPLILLGGPCLIIKAFGSWLSTFALWHMYWSPGLTICAVLLVLAALYPKDAYIAAETVSLFLALEVLNLKMYMQQRSMHRQLCRDAEVMGWPRPPFKFVRLQDRGRWSCTFWCCCLSATCFTCSLSSHSQGCDTSPPLVDWAIGTRSVAGGWLIPQTSELFTPNYR